MASLSKDSDGRYRIQFTGIGDKRHTVRLGKCDKRTATSIRVRVETLLNARIQNVPIDRDTAAWLAGIGNELLDRLSAVGLCEPRACQAAVGAFLSDWLARKTMGHKPTSIRAWKQTVDALSREHGSKALTSFAHSDAEAWRGAMVVAGLRDATIHKRLGHARQFFEDAVRLDLIDANPFRHVRHRSGNAGERRAYVLVEDIERAIEYAPNVHWKLLIALARFAGLRTPSEPLSLTWGDVDWLRGRLTVPSPKTEHLGKPHRIVPMFPMLRPYLELAYDQAPEGEVFIFPAKWRGRSEGKDGWGGANLRTNFAKIVRRAGLEPWPRIWHSLRASCESDLASAFPLPTVTKWLGNTPSVALRHYVDPTEDAFTKAQEWIPTSTQGDANSDAKRRKSDVISDVDGSRIERTETTQPLDFQGVGLLDSSTVNLCHSAERECMGIEPTESFVQTLHWF